MKAVVYDVPRQVGVNDVPDARIERLTDVLVRIATTNIRGSDLRMYEGHTGLEPVAIPIDDSRVPRCRRFVRDFVDSGRPVASICHGPWSLVEADRARGRRLTSWPGVRTDLRNAVAEVVDEEVVTDGNITTSRSPDDLPAFRERIVQEYAAAATSPAGHAASS